MEESLKFSWEKSTLVIGSEYIYRGADYKNKYGKHHRNDYAAFLEAKKEFRERLKKNAENAMNSLLSALENFIRQYPAEYAKNCIET